MVTITMGFTAFYSSFALSTEKIISLFLPLKYLELRTTKEFLAILI